MKKWFAVLLSMVLLLSCLSPLALATEALEAAPSQAEEQPFASMAEEKQTETHSGSEHATAPLSDISLESGDDPTPTAVSQPTADPKPASNPEPSGNSAPATNPPSDGDLVVETYTSGDEYIVELNFPQLNNGTSCKNVTVVLTAETSNGSTKRLDQKTLQPVSGGTARISFSLEGVPKNYSLWAKATAYGSINLNYAYDKQLNATAAKADAYGFICTNSHLRCVIDVELLVVPDVKTIIPEAEADQSLEQIQSDDPNTNAGGDAPQSDDPNTNTNVTPNQSDDPNANTSGDANHTDDSNTNANGDANQADVPTPNANANVDPDQTGSSETNGHAESDKPPMDPPAVTNLTVQQVWLYSGNDVSASGGPSILANAQSIITLQRSADQETTWETVTDAGGNSVQAVLSRANGWTASFSDLPAYTADNGNALIYRAVEVTPAGWYAVGIPVVKDGICILTNVITISDAQVMIDNTTQNPVRTATNVGGYVAVAGDNWQYDISGYALGKNTVAWKNEVNWIHNSMFTVSYQEIGSTDWKNVVCSTGNISALKQIDYFQYANLSQASKDGVTTYTLTLSPNAADLPLYTRVEVSFAATLAVENTTYKNRGGQVGIEDWNDAYSGRSANLYASGYASSGYTVRKNYLQIGTPGQVNDQYHKNKKAIRIRNTSDFKVYISTVLAGERVEVPVTGSVVVYKRDSYGNPIHVCYRFDSLPIPLDVGVPFRAYDSSYGPQTGDPMPYVAGLMGVSGVLLFVLRDDKRKKSVK